MVNYKIYIVIFLISCLYNLTKADITDNIYFLQFKSNISDYDRIPYKSAAQTICQSSSFNPTYSTIFHFHGWTEIPLTPTYSGMDTSLILVPEYLKVGNYNVFAVDYSKNTEAAPADNPILTLLNYPPSYLDSVYNVSIMAPYMKKFFTEFFDACGNLNHTVLTGFSIGGQFVGLIGKNYTYNGMKLPLIKAMDPAGPLYYLSGDENHLTSTDADIVHVIHSSAGVAGYPFRCAKADFWPNGGIQPQPGCSVLDAYCSHYASAKYMAYSVTNSTAYPSDYCVLCDHTVQYMGFWTSITASGSYYLQAKTN